MSIHVALHHRTVYAFDRPVTIGPHVARLRPAAHCRTPILSYSFKVRPAQHFINWQQDAHGNFQARLVFPEPSRELIVDVDLVASVTTLNPFDFFLEPTAEHYPFEYDPAMTPELQPYRQVDPPGPLLARYLAGIDRSRVRTVDFLVELNSRLRQEIDYVIRMDPGVQTAEETLGLHSGSCRDSSWLLVQILRHLGFAARFVSGYLIQLTLDVKPLDGPAGVDRDFTDLHAWAEVFLPGAGWVGLDPTSGLLAGEGHLPLACTPAPGSAAPITGTTEPCEVAFHHEMSVERVFETPRVTKPYSEEAWAAIEALGRRIDTDLQVSDVRLTMGGEPTFVSIDDMDGAEWNTAALGPDKRRMAGTLIRRLAQRFAPGHFIHFGQGKWYPGESLPRWALTCWWRRDGEPIWRDPRLIAEDGYRGNIDYSAAERFATHLAHRLAIDPGFLLQAYEDSWYYLWREHRLPVNVDPHHSKLKDPEERARLAKVFDQALDSPVGLALPLQPGNGKGRWQSGLWPVRSDRLYLIPGDSPMGYRLPLDSLPWVHEHDYPWHIEEDPFAPRPPLPRRASQAQPERHPPQGQSRLGGDGPSGAEEARRALAGDSLQLGRSAPWVIRTALCVEPREGMLKIFMPPVDTTEDYLDLVAAIEDVAEDLGQPVQIEGYAPPIDSRLKHFSVTPDPGVIEVNIFPSASWSELVDTTLALYEEARQSRLSAEKFNLDGRHVGTGGGNHIVVGGPTAGDSPLLRRPDLLKSLVSYWLNHPSLSFLFSSQFIGPTSQAPRVDEARNDALYELEIAFGQLSGGRWPGDAPPPPWLIDRVLRHILVDATGNTHRAEFCIDKLYSPDSPSGRHGLAELRSFEMPPHARMSLAQQLLVRGLIACFWRQPYERKLVRWDTQLHDRFMLPHFVAEDFADVIAELQRAGFEFDLNWFQPHHEFRFPALGSVAYRNIELELRQALEPWHVLGEEVTAGGTSRFVDSSVERLQVKVRGLTDSRHLVACNGQTVPLHPTGTEGEYVAGIRYRAWQPPSCLHPTIPVHTPLVFDIVDGWTERSIGGCTYHVAHPGGRSFDRFPVNAKEAESRRRSRFYPFGHTPGPLDPMPTPPNRDLPLTLDLRLAQPRGA